SAAAALVDDTEVRVEHGEIGCRGGGWGRASDDRRAAEGLALARQRYGKGLADGVPFGPADLVDGHHVREGSLRQRPRGTKGQQDGTARRDGDEVAIDERPRRRLDEAVTQA